MLGRCVAALGIVACALMGMGGETKADPSWRGRSRGRGGYHRPYVRPSTPWESFWGGVLGGWLGGQLSKPSAPTDEMVPGSPAWYAYCSNKYRSFDPETGTYLSFDGDRRPCR